MKKKFLSVLLLSILSFSVIGCASDKNKNTDKSLNEKIEEQVEIPNLKKIDEMGVSFNYTDDWTSAIKDGNTGALMDGIPGYVLGSFSVYFTPSSIVEKSKELEKNENLTDQEREDFLKESQQKMKPVFEIYTINKSNESSVDEKYKKFFEDNKSKFGEDVILKTEGDLEYHFVYNESPDLSNYSEEEKSQFNKLHGQVNKIKDSIECYKPVSREEKDKKNKEEILKQKLEFKTKTIDGKDIDSSIFSDSKVTMVNIWATTCGPCIEELPEIQKLYDDMKESGVNVIGILTDLPDDEAQELAKEIVKKKEVKFDNIIPDDNLKNGILKNITSTPTTIFIDSNGNLSDQVVIGANVEAYKTKIKEIINNK